MKKKSSYSPQKSIFGQTFFNRKISKKVKLLTSKCSKMAKNDFFTKKKLVPNKTCTFVLPNQISTPYDMWKCWAKKKRA